MLRILVVDDEADVRDTVRKILEKAEYVVETAANGQDALAQITRSRPDLVILDVMMPDMSGTEVCRRIRANPQLSRLPVLFLTAKGRPNDIVEGLHAGGDDYLTKPFEVIELPARVHALLRRTGGGILDTESEYLEVGGLQIHSTRLEATVNGLSLDLTAIEHQLLHYLMMHAGQPVATDQLLQDVWEYPPGVGNPNLVQVTIGRLRGKLEVDEDTPQYIQNVRGRGYMISG